MRIGAWFVVAVVGFGVMVAAYSLRPRPDPEGLWANGLMLVGPVPTDTPELPRTSIPTSLRFLPGNVRTEFILKVVEQAKPAKTFELQALLRPKLILVPLDALGINASSLQSGRLPVPDRNELLEGALCPHQERLEVGGQSLTVVGTLNRDMTLFAESYLVPDSASAGQLFPKGDTSVHHAVLVGLTREQQRGRHGFEALEQAYPASKYTYFVPSLRMERRAYYLYLAGQALFLLGGSGTLIGVFRWAAERVKPAWLSAPLREMSRRPRLLWGVHLCYFGLVILSAVGIYEWPDVQTSLVSVVRGEIAGTDGAKGPGAPAEKVDGHAAPGDEAGAGGGGSLLAAAGRAYRSGSIPRAAAVTFLVNFLLGSILYITLPSMIMPGFGVLVAALRAVTWGALLGPTLVETAGTMLPHSGTLLLEGEGYILATFFALLLPVQIAQESLGGTPLSRYGRALLLNVEAQAWVAIVLAVAAVYEAIEIVMMMRMT
jgi:hypothetical protein